MLAWNDDYKVSQVDIAFILDVSKSLITKWKNFYRVSKVETRQGPGRKTALSEVFPKVQAFIERQAKKGRSVTKAVLMAFMTDKEHTDVSWTTLSWHLLRHGYGYVLADPTDAPRVAVTVADIARFYNVTLPTALNVVHPSLVFNADEMGAEAFADRKRVYVVIPPTATQRDKIPIGVPRSTRRCTLLACISLDGSRVCPTILTKTKNVSSRLHDGGSMSDRLKVYSTETSFMTANVFGEWLCDVFIPEVSRRRAWLRERLGTVNEWAVLIMDGCLCHKKEEFRLLLDQHDIEPVLLVPHSSHMTQALDVGVFGQCKNLIRSDTRYLINLGELDEAIAQTIEAENNEEDAPQEAPQEAPEAPQEAPHHPAANEPRMGGSLRSTSSRSSGPSTGLRRPTTSSRRLRKSGSTPP